MRTLMLFLGLAGVALLSTSVLVLACGAQITPAPSPIVLVTIDPTVVPAPMNTSVLMTATVTGLVNITANGVTLNPFRLFISSHSHDEGQQLATVKANYNTLYAGLAPLPEMVYRVWVESLFDKTIKSNELLLIVGSAKKHRMCAGGLLPTHSTPTEINAYTSKYDTLNCYYMEPPNCGIAEDVVMVDGIRNCVPDSETVYPIE